MDAATRARLEALFAPGDREVASRLLLADFPLADHPQLCQRIHFAVLKLSAGRLDELRKWIAEALVDWRDVLVAAEFADSTTAHLDWTP